MYSFTVFLLLAVITAATQGFVLSGRPAAAFRTDTSVQRSSAISADEFYPQHKNTIVTNKASDDDDRLGLSCPFAAFLDTKHKKQQHQHQQLVAPTATTRHHGDTTSMKRRYNQRPNLMHGIMETVLFMFFRMIIRPEQDNNDGGPSTQINKKQQPNRGEDFMYNLVADAFVGFVGVVAKPLSRLVL